MEGLAGRGRCARRPCPTVPPRPAVCTGRAVALGSWPCLLSQVFQESTVTDSEAKEQNRQNFPEWVRFPNSTTVPRRPWHLLGEIKEVVPNHLGFILWRVGVFYCFIPGWGEEAEGAPAEFQIYRRVARIAQGSAECVCTVGGFDKPRGK